MIALLKKELRSFFSSLTAYLVLFIFLLINGMFLWVFKNEMNIFDSNYAGLDGFFFISPWVLMFLVAAITMKMFSEEIKSGTFELLLTHPLSDFQIVISKYFASILL
ncbi:MAG: gliding motility-associated ABC transporter permease subunit GldF, partial [Bacteroidales bacterium]|nr:gliding motility-associated ABC transporter permease subunit GldF [Bacteroidales bacterium]